VQRQFKGYGMQSVDNHNVAFIKPNLTFWPAFVVFDIYSVRQKHPLKFIAISEQPLVLEL